MSRKILVAYATRYGSTQEVAEAVATIFCEEGLEVESKPAQKVASLAEHRAMVLGAPLYFGAWPKEALDTGGLSLAATVGFGSVLRKVRSGEAANRSPAHRQTACQSSA